MKDTARHAPVGAMEGDTITAISTATGKAGIGIVRLSGPEAFAIAERIFKPVTGKVYRPQDNRKLRFGWIVDDAGVRVDEVLVSFMKGPHTYTAEDIVEINAHGGAVSVRRILQLTLSHGARLADRGEFTRRAFLNGRMDLAQAEAVLDVIDAKTTKAHEQAVAQLSGRLSGAIAALKRDTLDLLARIEYAINFMEDAQEELPVQPMIESAEFIASRMKQLIDSSDRGRLVREGISTVIVGKPNVGKSSLLNALLDDNRAIVTDIPGTTRDAIEESYNLDGVQLRLIDTAGIRETEDIVEAMGVDRSRDLAARADLILALFDGASGCDASDDELFEELKHREVIYIMNKGDLPRSPSAEAFEARVCAASPQAQWVHISAREHQGLDQLQSAIMKRFFEEDLISDSEVTVTNVRHAQLLRDARADLLSCIDALRMGVALDACEVDLRSCYRQLGEITGEVMDDDILNKIFHDFCIGK